MARENQGLQVALIIFVMLTIILGVTTFIFSKMYGEQWDRAEKLQGDLDAANQANRNIQDDNTELKEMILGSADAAEKDVDKIMEQFNEDMETYAAGYDKEDKSYRPVLIHLYDLANEKNAALADANNDLQALQDKYDAWQKAGQEQIDKHETAWKEAEKKAQKVERAYAGDLDLIRAAKDKIKAELESDRKEHKAELAAVQAKLENLGAQTAQLQAINQKQAKQIDRFTATTIDVPDGEISAVEQRSGTVWLNRGQADALQQQTTFSVYPADITNLARAGKKASIEVTRIRGNHLAEARIIEDTIADPIMPGDKIYTPVWSPGQQVGFALVGLLDVDDDGRSDRQIVRQLIERQGGRVDYEMDEKGQVLQDGMNINTRYVVVDSESLEVEAQPDEAKAKAADTRTTLYSQAMDQARQLGIKKITLGELMQQMGWKKPTHVVRLGREANARDFQPKPPEGVPRVSSGNVSDLFRPRRPSARQPSPRGGAY